MNAYKKETKKKKGRIKWLIGIGISFFVIGIIVIIIGIIMGGKWDSLIYRGESVNMEEEFVSGVEKIKIRSDFGTVRVEKGDKFSIKGNNVQKNGFYSRVENGEWVIKDKAEGIFSLFGLQVGPGYIQLGGYDGSTELIVTVPGDFIAEDLSIKIGGGKCYLSDLTVEDFDLDIGAGEGEIFNLVVSESSDIKVGAGKIRMEKMQLKEAEFDCGVGSIQADGSIQGDADVKCGVGKINLNLNGKKENYNYDVKCGIGEVDVDGDKFSNENSELKDSEYSNYKFNLKCGIGKIQLKFNE